MERKLPVKVSENLGIPREVVLFLDILENAAPLATGSCRNSNQTFRFNESALRELSS